MLFLYFMTTNAFCCSQLPDDEYSMVIPNDDESHSLLQIQTVNDVLFGIISVGLFKYIDHQSPNGKKRIAFPSISEHTL